MKRLAAAGASKLHNYLKQYYDDSLYSEFEKSLMLMATKDEVGDFPDFSGDDISSRRIRRIFGLLGGNEVARTALELSVLSYLEPSVLELFGRLSYGGKSGATLELATKLTSVDGGSGSLVTDTSEAFGRLSLILMFEETEKDPMFLPMSFDLRLASWLNGSSRIDDELEKIAKSVDCRGVKPDIFAFEEETFDFAKRVTKLASAVNSTDRAENLEGITVLVSGEKDSGRFSAVRCAAYEMNAKLIKADYDDIVRTKRPARIIKKLVRECILEDALLCIHGLKKDREKTSDTVKVILEEVMKDYDIFLARPLFLVLAPDVKVIPFVNGKYILHSIRKCLPGDSVKMWEGFLKDLAEEDRSLINVYELASKMVLTAGQIRKIVHSLKTRILSEPEGFRPDNRLIYRICYEVLDDGRYENIKRVTSKYTLDDIKIDETNRRILRDICNMVIYREQVFDSWNIRKKYAYGRCISAMFAGPPGTGKTMAVHAIANELGLELYKVDLSQLVDKYIGETEKRLEEVFTRAEKSNMILFFDEADAVMGKRSETTDAKDKYANTEIAYILQRIEEYDGIVIMATNYVQNVDTAFMRRIRYIVNFEMPDKKIRKEIWQTTFAKEVPVGDIDFDYLAETFELSGGEIKNIILNAVFYAAAENSKVSMPHILRAIYREKTKDKKVAFTEDFGAYSYLKF